MRTDQSAAGAGVAVVVVTRNRKELLRRCLAALRAQTLPPARIVVVDNESSDGTPEMLRADFPEVDNLRLDENIGGAGGFCEGMKAAAASGCAWIWTMDDDCLPGAAALEELAAVAREGAVYGSVTLSEKGGGAFASFNVNLTSGGVERKVYNISELAGVAAAETTGIGFGGLFISRLTVEKVGFPRKDFFVYADDSEYSRRLRLQHGIRMFYAPGSVILHPPQQQRTALVFGRSVPYVAAPLWKTYYNIRNQVYVSRLYSRGLFGFYLGYLPRQILFLSFRAFFLDEDENLKRFYFYLVAVFDGVFGRLGKRDFKRS